MSLNQTLPWALAPLLCTSLLWGAAPSHADAPPSVLEAQSIAAQPSTADWQTFRSPAEGFQVSMPSQPVQYRLPNDQAARMYMQMRLSTPNQLEMYAVGVAQLPGALTRPQDVQQMLTTCAQLASQGSQQAKAIPMPFAC